MRKVIIAALLGLLVVPLLRARSLLIHVSGILGMLGLRNVAGVYRASVDRKHATISVNLQRRLIL